MTDIRLTAASVTAAMAPAGAELRAGDPATGFSGVSIDTRTLATGELFVAIKGDRFDGAAFANDAIARGAAGIVLPRAASGSPTADARTSGTARTAVIEVDDTTAALQALANAVRRESGTKVVAITGSAGKTTTKEITSELLSARYRVIRNKGNFNNHIGLPLSLLELRHRPEIAVVELGMNHAGEISTLVRIAEPDVRIWTNVGDAHVGFFASVDAIADAKAEILEAPDPDDVLVANADDARVMSRAARFKRRVITFGIEHQADVRATDVVDRGVDGCDAIVRTPRGSAAVTLPLVGRTNLLNFLAATAVAVELGVPLDAVAERASRLSPASHRGEVVRLTNGVTVIDDSYNANPTATIRALDVLARTAADRRIAVLGEMLELGDHSVALHQKVGRAVASHRLDALFAVGGPPARALADAAVDDGMSAGSVRAFATSDEAAADVAAFVRRGDLVLVKGSRGIKTDRVVDRLKAGAA